jgi:hypothetical protein
MMITLLRGNEERGTREDQMSSPTVRPGKSTRSGALLVVRREPQSVQQTAFNV